MFTRLIYIGYRLGFRLWFYLPKRFTAPGLVALTVLAISAVFGLDTNRTTAYQIFTLLLALFLAALIFSLFFRGRFEVRRFLPRFITAGEPLTYRVRVRNLGSRFEKGLQLEEVMGDARPVWEEVVGVTSSNNGRRKRVGSVIWISRWLKLIAKKQGLKVEPAEVPNLPPNGEIEVRLEAQPLRRGRVDLEGVRLVRPDPLGLARAQALVKLPGSLLVLPRRYPLPPVSLPGTRKHQPGGVALASSVGDSEEFVSLRDYRPGDPVRRIHWTSWAKTGKPIVKEYQEEFFVRHALVLDTFDSGAPDEAFEEAVSVAASFASTVRTQESLLDLMFVGPQAYCFTSGRGLLHTDRMLEILASVSICHDKPFSMLKNMVIEKAPALSGCICVLLGWDEDRKKFVELLRALRLPTKVLVLTGRDFEEELDPGPMKDSPHNFHQLTVGRIEEGLARI